MLFSPFNGLLFTFLNTFLIYLSLKYVNLDFKNALNQIELERPHCERVCELYITARTPVKLK